MTQTPQIAPDQLMAMTSKQRREVILEAAKAEGGDVQTKIEEAMLPAPSQTVTDQIWRWVIKGLTIVLVISVVSIVGLIWFDKRHDPMLTIATAILTFMGGLFAKSPVEKRQ